MDQNTQSGFARADDDVQLYWRLTGQGNPIVCCNGVGVSTFFWRYVAERFAPAHRVLLWDYRGHGRSQRTLDPHTADMSVRRHADDLDAIMQAALPGQRAVLVGHSMGCQVALELWRRNPDRVAGVVLMLGTAGRTLETFFDNPRSPTVFRALHRLAFAAGPGGSKALAPVLESPLAWKAATRLKLVDPYYTKQEDMLPYMTHLAGLDLRLFMESVIQCNEHDAWPDLPRFDLPLLVIAGENDTFTPLWCSRKIVDLVPDAELLVLADASHAALVEQPETINHRIARFLRERLEGWAALA